MKKLFLMALLAFVVWIGLLSAPFSADDSFLLELSSREIIEQDSFFVTVKSSMPIPEVYAFQLGLSFNSDKLEFMGAEGLLDGYSLQPHLTEDGVIFGFTKRGTEAFEHAVSLAKITFKNKSAQNSEIKLVEMTVIDEQLNQVEYKQLDVTCPVDITVLEPTPTPVRTSAPSWGSSGSGGSGGGGGGGGGVPTIIIPPLVESLKATPTPEPTPVPSAEPNENVGEFVDLEHVPWAVEAINRLSQLAIINGVGDNLFKPDDYLTRAAYAKMLSLAFDFYDAEAVCQFEDVHSDSWYMTYIASCYNAGIINGYDDKAFPENNITRQEMFVMLHRTLAKIGIELTHNQQREDYLDKEHIADWAQDAIMELYQSGIINGSDGMLLPNENATRAQAAVIIHSTRLLYQ